MNKFVSIIFASVLVLTACGAATDRNDYVGENDGGCDSVDLADARDVANWVLDNIQVANPGNILCVANENNQDVPENEVLEFIQETQKDLVGVLDGVAFMEIEKVGVGKINVEFGEVLFEFGRSAKYDEVYTIALTKYGGNYYFEDIWSPDTLDFDSMEEFAE